MGKIHEDVYRHLRHFAEHEPILRAFLTGFDITWTSDYSRYGADFTVYFLKPSVSTARAIGVDKEMALVLSMFPELHAKTLQAADAFLNELPAAGRVEPLAYVLVAPVQTLTDDVSRHLNENRQSRLIVPFTWDELHNATSWFIRSRFTDSLTARDSFDMQQPLVTDTYYFGRTQFVTDLLDRFRTGENSGLFGLRKTGKTSAVFKLRRQIESSSAGVSVYIDAQNPNTYARRWWELLEFFAAELAEHAGAKPPRRIMPPYTENAASSTFQSLVEYCLTALPNNRKRILLIVDEIEHIVPDLGPEQARHWNSDFIPLWKTLRAIQTVNRGLTFLIVGVNAGAVERPSIERQDNPLFSLVGTRYLPSFNQSEVSELVRTIGRPMGMRFTDDALTYLAERYGGHPTLTRLACSWHHKRAQEMGAQRPFTLTVDNLRGSEETCELTLIPHVSHILEVLRLWYSDEFEMLEMLAQGNISAFGELAAGDPQLKHHLDQYGLLRWEGEVPRLGIAVVGNFLRSSRRTPRRAAPDQEEPEWLELVTEESRLRNRLEPKLRRYVKRTLRAHLGSERWIDPILAAVPSERREKLKGVDRDEILADRLFLSDLITVVEVNWDKYFKALESSTKHRIEKAQVSLLLKYVNAHRADAHAKATSQTDVLTLAIVCQTLDAALHEAIEE